MSFVQVSLWFFVGGLLATPVSPGFLHLAAAGWLGLGLAHWSGSSPCSRAAITRPPSGTDAGGSAVVI